MTFIKNAIILAAGKGERLRPLTLRTPKPLLPIAGKPMIENLIECLHQVGIKEIAVVVGYLKEQFGYLTAKYGVDLVDNPDFEKANNISSLYYARNRLGDTVILDGDQIITDATILRNDGSSSGYVCKWNGGVSGEWLLNLGQQNQILSCSRDGGRSGWELRSVSFWTKDDATRLKELVEFEYKGRGRTDIYWDDIAMFLHREDFHLFGFPIEEGSLIEIDNYDEYIQINKSRGKML